MPLRFLGKHLTIRGYELFEITADDAKCGCAKKFLTAGLTSGKLWAKIDQVFEATEIAAAPEHLESNTQVGKVVVRV
ncbi:zinc-binding dehydrogenase [Falsirhodobacter deserti]|uniref:zinc-binding dehydrogenase n=1 Tax=Falsirhodobacter deserti TaxID=1365611 RepID=UPI000FE3C3B9|nr:zinc-binding dehydrogenase [Falsirhodobacter deserti]